MEPRDYAAHAESLKSGLSKDWEHFSGWGIMGLPFRSGHILGLRRFPAASIGPGYTSLWHRDSAGTWTFYADAQPMQSCNRYFGSAVERFVLAIIDLTWEGPRRLTVRIPDASLEWTSDFVATAMTRGMNALGSLMPEFMWRSSMVLGVMSRVAGVALRAGAVRMHGRAPNGQSFIANPRLIWTISDATATLGRHDFGPPGPVRPQAWLGDFALPQRGMLAVGAAFFEPFDQKRHLAVSSREESRPALSSEDSARL